MKFQISDLRSAFVFTAGLAVCLAASPDSFADDADPALLTVAEKSDFRATARYADVVALCQRLAASSPLVKLSSLGKSGEGRDLPLLLIADPPVSLPSEPLPPREGPGSGGSTAQSGPTRAAAPSPPLGGVGSDGRLLVLAIGNIHAGEVDGKEALPMLAREIVAASKPGAPHPLLKDLILAFAPIYNADGNERVSKTNRPGQLGPEEGMGQRENAAGLDLNRDFIKLEASETRGLVDFLNRYDPAVFIDCHTTNGCFHRYIITYEGPKCPAGDLNIVRFCRDEMMPAIGRECESKYGVPCFVYGDFNKEHTKWDTYPAHARYGTTYVGLRNRISILSEGYSYATYKQRVLGTRDFVKACLEYAAANKSRIRKLLTDADIAAFNPTTAVVGSVRAAQSEPTTEVVGPAGTQSESGAQANPSRSIALHSKAMPAPKSVTARGFVEEQRDGRSSSTGQAKDYDIDLWTHFEPTLTVQLPYAYLIPENCKAVIDKLREHGIQLETLSTESDAAVEVYRIDKLAYAEPPFQKHKMLKVETASRKEQRRIPAGTIVVRTNQKLGGLAAYLLEPQCEDGLLTWNFFDDLVKIGEEFPIARCLSLPAK